MDRFGMHQNSGKVLRQSFYLPASEGLLFSPILYVRAWRFGCESMPGVVDRSMHRVAIWMVW